MLKREIKYEDFNGEEVSEIFYFNISKPELIELEVEYDSGFSGLIETIVETKDNQALVRMFKKIVLLAYGQKSEDGKRFVKSDQLREEFSQTAAYQTLFMELALDDGAAVKFLKGVLPSDMSEEIDKATTEISPPLSGGSSPPTPPAKTSPSAESS